jgi:hypothetical protein
MFINMYKNWPDHTHVGGSPLMEKFMEIEKTPMDESEDVIASLLFLELDENSTIGLR